MFPKRFSLGVLVCALLAAGCDDPRLYPPKTAPSAAAGGEAPAALTAARTPLRSATSGARGASAMLELVPEGTVGIVCVPKIKNLEQALDRINTATGLAKDRRNSKFTSLPMMLRGLGLDMNDFDANRPAGFAMTFPAGAKEPLMTAILPARDEKAMAAKLRTLSPRGGVETSNGFAILTEKGRYQRGVTPDYLSAPLPEGDLVVRFDAAALWKRFGPSMSEEMERSLAMLDGAGLAQPVMDGMKSVLEAASVYDVALRVVGTEIEVETAVKFQSGAQVPLLDVFSKTDLVALARAIPDEGMVSLAMAIDAGKLWKAVEPLVRESLEMYPEDARKVFAQAFDSMGASMKSVGRGMAVSGGLENGRIEIVGVMESDVPAGYLKSVTGMMSELPAGGSPFTIKAPEERTVAGTKVTTIRMQVDPAKVSGAMTGARATKSREAFETLFGKDGLAYNFVALDQRVLFVLGSDDLLVEALAAARTGPEETPGQLSKSIATAGKDTVGYLRIDLAAMAREMMALGSAIGGTRGGPKVPPSEPIPLTCIVTRRPGEFRGRVSVDIGKLAKAFAPFMGR